MLYQYPEGGPLTPDAAHFCFPHGVQPSLLERTPSMSALNELVYSQQYQHSDASSFIFVLKVPGRTAPQVIGLVALLRCMAPVVCLPWCKASTVCCLSMSSHSRHGNHAGVLPLSCP